MADYPLIRDTLVIDESVQAFYDQCTQPVFLLGRVVQLKPGFELRLTNDKPLTIIADHFDGKGGWINASGDPQPHRVPPVIGPSNGVRGKTGTWPGYVIRGGVTRPKGPGGVGGIGGPGNQGLPGGHVRLWCRTGADMRVNVLGGSGSYGGAGGNGSSGVDSVPLPPTVDGESSDASFEGTPGGRGGRGGPGGPGGPGGTLSVTSTAPVDTGYLFVGGGRGGPGGPGGGCGADGMDSTTMCCPPDAENCQGPDGAEGPQGSGPPASVAVISDDDFAAQVRAVLAERGFAPAWIDHRLEVGEYFYRLFNPKIPALAGYGSLAAAEFDAILGLQSDHPDATRLQRQLSGIPVPMGAQGEIILQGGGTNVLGLSRELDLIPRFDLYISAFTSFGTLVLQFLNQGIAGFEEAEAILVLKNFAIEQMVEATAARDNAKDEVVTAKLEKEFSDKEETYAREQLEKITADIQKAMVEMNHHSISLMGVLGTVGQVGAAVVSVAAAIPSGGASLVVLVPSVLALANTVLNDVAPIAQALFAGSKPNLDEIKDAYGKAGKNVEAVVKAGKAVVNFVKVIDEISAGKTPDNSKYLALVKQGAELTHQVLMAGSRSAISQQRLEAVQARLARAEQVIMAVDTLKANIVAGAEGVRRAGLVAIQTAQAKVDNLLDFAFRAQRSVEIYTLQDQSAALAFDAGRLHPDRVRDYAEKQFTRMTDADLATELTASWGRLLKPIDMQRDYLQYFQDGNPQRDSLRLSFKTTDELQTIKETHSLAFFVDPDDLPDDCVETKINGVAIALVGASTDAVSCRLRHEGRYLQRAASGEVVQQFLEPKQTTQLARTSKLSLGGVDFNDRPLDAPSSLAFWGRGIGGQWTLTIKESEFESGGLDLTNLSEVQIWIGYNFRQPNN